MFLNSTKHFLFIAVVASSLTISKINARNTQLYGPMIVGGIVVAGGIYNICKEKASKKRQFFGLLMATAGTYAAIQPKSVLSFIHNLNSANFKEFFTNQQTRNDLLETVEHTVDGWGIKIKQLWNRHF